MVTLKPRLETHVAAHGGRPPQPAQMPLTLTRDETPNRTAVFERGVPRLSQGNSSNGAGGIGELDKQRLLGLSVIEEISQETKDKLLFKCPRCGLAGIKARRTKLPLYKCYKCKHEFDKPDTATAAVTEYRSRHDAAWTALENLLPGTDLRLLCESPKSQLSMRPLRWSAFRTALAERGADRAVDRVVHRAPDFFFSQGHTLEIVRVRRGQQHFREHLLSAQGEVCAFTGDAPARVLEAGHLYSYAELGVHHEHGGLLLRRDIHRLFDDGLLAVHPGSLLVDVGDKLENYPQYASLHDRQLRTHLRDGQVEWLARHWAEHRAS